MNHPILARIIVLAAITILVIVDIALVSFGKASISSQVTYLNQQSNWLLALGLMALYIHWFIVPLFVK